MSSADAFLGTLTHGTGWNLPMLLHGKAITMKVDTGADVTAIPATVFTSLDLPMSLAPSNRTLRGPDNTSLNVCGRFTADLRTAHSSQSHSGSVPTQVYVVRDLKLPLLGRPAIEALGILPAPANVLETTSTSSDSASDSRSPVAAEFPDLFSGLGTFGPLHTIQLRDEAPPYSLSTPRRVALPMESKVIEALRRMEAAGVIRPVSEPTDWCAGMVVVPKPNGSVRICGDFTRLNKAVKRERHILPTTDHLLARLGDAKVLDILSKSTITLTFTVLTPGRDKKRYRITEKRYRAQNNGPTFVMVILHKPQKITWMPHVFSAGGRYKHVQMRDRFLFDFSLNCCFVPVLFHHVYVLLFVTLWPIWETEDSILG